MYFNEKKISVFKHKTKIPYVTIKTSYNLIIIRVQYIFKETTATLITV